MKFRRNAMRTFWVAVLASSCVALGASQALGQSALPNTVIAGGGATVAAGPFRLHSTIGEPVAGRTTNGNTTIVAGFQATFVFQADPGPDGGRIFYDGFEGND